MFKALTKSIKGSLLLLLTVNCLLPFQINANAWTQKASFSAAGRIWTCGFSLTSTAGKTRGYICAGWIANYSKDLWEYDAGTDAWTQKADFGGGKRYGMIGVTIGTKGYVGMGFDSTASYKNDLWEYDPVANIWTQKSNLPGAARRNLSAFSIGSKGYFATGEYASNSCMSDIWEYDPILDTWTLISGSFPNNGPGREFGVAFSIGTKGYFGTGIDGSNTYYDDWWEFNPGNNSWTQKAVVPGSPRWGAAGFSIASSGFAGLGYSINVGGSSSRDFYKYDPGNNVWIAQDSFPNCGRGVNVGFSIGSKGYISAGWSSCSAYSNDLWEFDPALSGIEESKNNISVTIYPNPFTDHASFTFSTEQKNAQLKLFDIAGELEKEVIFSGKQLAIERDNLSPGIYFYQISSLEKVIATGKLLIQ